MLSVLCFVAARAELTGLRLIGRLHYSRLTGGCGLVRRAAQRHANPVDVSFRAPQFFGNLVVRVTVGAPQRARMYMTSI